MSPNSLLKKLLDYVLEQDKEVDPRGFKLQGYKGFLKGRADLQGLPDVDFDIKLDGDHVWVRVARLEAKVHDLVKTPANEGYFKYHLSLGCYIEIVSYDEVLNASKKRNCAFFDRLQIPTNQLGLRSRRVTHVH